MKSVGSNRSTLAWLRLLVKYRSQKLKKKANRLQIALLSEALREDSVFFDIGANKGLFTYWASKKIGKKGSIHAFEPQPELGWIFNSLDKNFPSTKINFNNFGLSKSRSEGVLNRTCIGDGSASLKINQNQDFEKIKVRLETLDGYCKKNSVKRVDFIKIDVEGHEFDALDGGSQIIKELHPKMLIEMSPSSKSTELIENLVQLEYKFKMIAGGKTFLPNSEFAEVFLNSSGSFAGHADVFFY